MGGSVEGVKKSLQDTGNDINDTLDAVRNGNSGGFAKGLVGLQGASSSAFGAVPAGNFLNLKSPSGQLADANAAKDQAMYDQNTMNDQLTADRVNKVTTRLNEAVKLRQKQPGRAQTLLTSTLTGPNSGNPDTLLTSVSKG